MLSNYYTHKFRGNEDVMRSVRQLTSYILHLIRVLLLALKR